MVLRDTCLLAATEEVKNSHRLLEFQAFLPVDFSDANAFVIEDEGLELRFAFSQKDRDRMLLLEADVQRLAGLLGRWRRGCERTWFPHGAAHLVATCRMDRPD